MQRKLIAATALILSASVAIAFTVNTSSASAQTNGTCRPGQVCLK